MIHKSKSNHLTLRLPPDLREAIEEAAEQDRRPTSSLVRIVLEDWVKERADQVRSAA